MNEDIKAKKQLRREAMQQLTQRDELLAKEIAERSRERSELKVKFDLQQGALAQLDELLPEEPTEQPVPVVEQVPEPVVEPE